MSCPRNPEGEARAVLSVAERWRASGIPFERQVVVARRHSTLLDIAARLTASGVAVERVGDLLSNEAVLDLLAVARLAEDRDGSSFRRLAALDVYGLAPSVSEAFLGGRQPGETSLDLLLRRDHWPRRGIPSGEREKLDRMSSDLSSTTSGAGPWETVTAWLFGRSGYLSARQDHLGPVHAAIERRSIRDFLGVCEEQHRIGDMSSANLTARVGRLRSRLQETNHSRDPRRPVAGALRLMTIHESKGRAFEAVHLVGLSDWRHATNDGDRRSEEALFDIAVSRASRRLHISHMTSSDKHRTPQFIVRFEGRYRRAKDLGPRSGTANC